MYVLHGWLLWLSWVHIIWMTHKKKAILILNRLLQQCQMCYSLHSQYSAQREERSHKGIRYIGQFFLSVFYHTVHYDSRMQYRCCSQKFNSSIQWTENAYGWIRQRTFYSESIIGSYNICLPFMTLTWHRKLQLQKNTGPSNPRRKTQDFIGNEILELTPDRSFQTLTFPELNEDIFLRFSISLTNSSDGSTTAPEILSIPRRKIHKPTKLFHPQIENVFLHLVLYLGWAQTQWWKCLRG